MNQDNKTSICLKCRYKKFDVNRGLLCNLTNMPPNFENECPDFWDENQYSKNQSDILEVKKGHYRTIYVFAFIIISELLLVGSLLFTKTYTNFFYLGIVGVLLNALNFIGILASKKWAKTLLTTIYSFIILGGIILTIIGTFFINASPNLIIKIIVAVILCSITTYYINFDKTFLKFFNFKK